MEQALKALLSQIYAAPSLAQPNDSRPLSPDEFRMYIYKVIPCSRRGPHSWVECSFCHPGEKASRRDPQKFAYVPIACPDMKAEGRCLRSDNCLFAHNVFEYWLHPARYRTQLCSYGVECKRSICFFAHQPGELRVNEYIAQLQDLESKLEGNDPGGAFAVSNPRWPAASAGSSLQMAQKPLGQNAHSPRQQHTSDGMQANQLRQIQQAINNQGTSSGLSQQAMLSAALGGYLPGHSLPHASASAAAAALLEAALQPPTPPMTAPLGMNPSLSPRSSLLTPLASMGQSQAEESSMAATMKLLADLTAAHGQAQKNSGSGSTLQTTASMPILQQQQQHASAGSDVHHAVKLVSQLQQLANKAASSSAAGNSDLQSVLLSLLPQLLVQLAGGPTSAAPANAGQLSAPCKSVPIALDPLLCAQTHSGSGSGGSQHSSCVANATGRRESSPSPADALSLHSRRTAGSSCSSRLSDGSHSPTLSHHSDEGIRAFNGAFTGISKEMDGLALGGPSRDVLIQEHGPFSAMTGFQREDVGAKVAAATASPDRSSPNAKLLPDTLEHDEELASGMFEMSGASAMIAALSQLVDGAGTLNSDGQRKLPAPGTA